MNLSEFTNNLYGLPCIIKEDAINNQIIIIFENSQTLTVPTNQDKEFQIPEDILVQLNTKEKEELERIIWHFTSTPLYMRDVENWRKKSARESYFNNEQILSEQIGSLEKHWISEEQKALLKLF